MDIQPILDELRRRFRDHYRTRLEKLVLFGSRARGDADPDSDIDVLVVLAGTVDGLTEIDDTIGIVADVSLKHDCVVTCVFVSNEEYRTRQSPLMMNVRREGISL